MKHFPGLGGKVLGADGIEADSSDVRAQLTKVKAASPDIIFAPVHYTEGGAMLRQARELAVPGTVVGTDGGFDPQLIKIAGPAAEGSYWCTIGWGDPTTKQVTDEFVKRYKGKYGEQPGVYSGLYYDAAKVVAHAMAEAKSITGPGIKRALYQVKNYKGATGITSFDRYGDVEKPYSIYQVKSGQFNLVE
jgi:branched-chain amino acid transport system substrate-binding protein